ncbi:pilus assembly protein [Yersinia intermedia]|uniref:Putative tight adherance operon protein n=2 Tax=Yersinia intermedia TaxID=631 RepID=A0A0T9MGD4_YERIN|nr:pilus assembly protein [Yersinia intermedia]CNG08437.1 putative tight adherance operon protein [Yersinia intermedia]
MIKNRLLHVKVRLLVSLIKNEQGAILFPFIIFLPLIIGLIFFSFELAHFLQKKTKLSDAMEQATLALTVENNNSTPSAAQITKNAEIVSSYAQAYLPAETFSTPTINIIYNNGRVEYGAEINMSYSAKFLSNIQVTNLSTIINATDRGAARKNIISAPIEKTDVVFVADYSGSMDEHFNDDNNEPQKIVALREIFNRLNDNILKNENIRTIGFIPFSWGTKNRVENGTRIMEYCHLPFVPKKHSPNGDYLRKYTLSGLKQFPGLERLEHIDHIAYAKITEEIYNNTKNKIDELNIEDAKSADTFLFRSKQIIQQLNQLEIIEENINYDATINSILHNSPGTPPKTINIPINDILNNYVCLNKTKSYSLNENHSNEIINDMIKMTPLGGTLISSGILSANNLFNENRSNDNKKLMIILSDGDDSFDKKYKENKGFYVTQNLIKKGMCERIKENGVTMAFIAIGYKPLYDTKSPRYIDWKECVGEKNYYEAQNTYELEADLLQALGTVDTSEVGRNIPKS